MSDIALELAGVEKRYGASTAVAGMDLAIGKGEFVSLLGASGCGKSTTLMMIAGFEQPDAGEIRVRGRRIDPLPPDRRNVGVVFQAYALFPHMSVARNVEYGLRLRRIPAAERRRRVAAILDLVNMGHLAARMPAQLSGGQQQRVALARALVIEPDILLLDEPFSALDRQLRERLQREVREVQQKLGITTIFVTHDQEEALLMSDRIAVMHAGRIEQCASPQEIYQQPGTRIAASFIGRGTFLPGELAAAGGRARFAGLGQEVALPAAPAAPAGRATAFFRPEDVRRAGRGKAAAAPDAGAVRAAAAGAGVNPDAQALRLSGRVKAVYFQGAATSAELLVDGLAEPVLLDPAEWLRDGPLRAGDRLDAYVDAASLRIFAG